VGGLVCIVVGSDGDSAVDKAVTTGGGCIPFVGGATTIGGGGGGSWNTSEGIVLRGLLRC
jgi:hypothetical protein